MEYKIMDKPKDRRPTDQEQPEEKEKKKCTSSLFDPDSDFFDYCLDIHFSIVWNLSFINKKFRSV